MKKLLSVITATAVMASASFAQDTKQEPIKPALDKAQQIKLIGEFKKLKVLDSPAFTLNTVEDIGTMYMVNTNMEFAGQMKQVDVFISKDKEYIMFGNAYSATTGKRYASEKTPIKKDTSKLKSLSMFTMGTGKKDFYLFTDPDCPFCKQMEAKLHGTINNESSVHILPYPLERLHPKATGKVLYFMEMSDADKKKVMEKGLASVEVPKTFKPKKETITRLFDIKKEAIKMGLTGTPYLIDSDVQE